MAKTQKRSPITRLLSAVTALGSAVCMLPAMPNLTAAAVEEYELFICGTHVTSENEDDVLGDGVFCYDPGINVLTINGDATYDGTIIYSNEVLLRISVTGPSTLTSNNATTINLHGEYNATSISGAALKVYSPNDYGIYSQGGLHFKDANVYAEGKYPIKGEYFSALEVEDSVVYAVCTGDYGAVTDFDKYISYDQISIPENYHYYISSGCVFDAQTNAKAMSVLFGDKLEYDLTVADTQVTLLNSDDILGNGVFSYNAATKTLDIHGNYSYSGSNKLLLSSVPGLTINTVSDSVLTANHSSCFALHADTTITGSGELQLKAPFDSYCAVMMYDDADLTVENASLKVRGTYGLTTMNGSYSTLIFRNSYVYADCSYAVTDFRSIVLEDCSLKEPDNGYISSSSIYNEDDSYAKTVTIKPYSYDLRICGIQVSAENAADILGDGTLSYNAATQTLTMNGARINNDKYSSIHSNLDDLTINVASDSTITSTAASNAAITSNGNLTITGSGKLTIQVNYIAVYVPDANLTIKDANIDATGRYGLTGRPSDEKLTVINSRIHAAGIKGAISDFGDGIELQDCLIVSPDGAYILNDDIVTEAGSVAEEVTIVPDKFDLYVADTQVTVQNAADILGNGVCSFDALTNTLTISGNYTMNDTLYFIYNRINDLIIKVASDSVINVTKSCSINSSGHNMTITGPGKLTINGYIYIRDAELTIKDANLDVYGSYGITGEPYKDSLVIINSTIHAEGNNGAVCDFANGITLQDCYIASPENAIISNIAICDSDGSEAKTVDIMPGSALVITKQPENASGCIGDKVQFTVEAEGNGMIYQWQYYNTSTKKWENTGLAGNKTKTLTVTVTAARNNMKYHCIVKDPSGTKLVSDAATLKVNPKITAQPVDASGCIGDKVQFTVEANGVGLIYQWQYYNTSTKKWENTGLTGNQTTTLTVTVTAGRNNMKYHCIVKDTNGTKLTSTAAKLTVNPKIVTQPADASGAIGDKVQFTVEATGVGLIYQWQYYNTSTKKWENTGLTGNQTPTLTVTVNSARNGMKYHCIVKDSAGTKLTSTAAKLTVTPKIVTQPVDASGCIGDKVQFTVEATGVGLIYQWQYYNTSTKKWENTGLTGNQTPTLTVTVNSARNGMKYHCIVKDSAGTKLTSAAVTLKVLPKIVTQPKNVTATVNSTAKFTVEATGIGLTYQWQYYNTSTKKWENTGLAGNTTATLSVTAISSRNGMKYHCVIKDSAGNKLTSTAATLTVK